MTCKLFIVLVVVLLVVVQSKWVRLSGPFSKLKEHNGWHYLQKFTFQPGYAKFDIETFVRGKGKSKSHDLYIQGIPQQNWQKQQELKCGNPVKMPLLIQQMRMTGQKDRDILQFTVNDKPNTYYFVIKDCHQMFRKDYDNDNLTFHIHLRPYSNDVQIDDQPVQDTPNQPQEPEEEFIVIDNQQALQEQLDEQEKKRAREEQLNQKKETTLADTLSEQKTQQSTAGQVIEHKVEQVQTITEVNQNPQEKQTTTQQL